MPLHGNTGEGGVGVSKRNREKRRHIGTLPLILQSLRVDFSCTEEDIELITQALNGQAPISVVEHMDAIAAGKVTLSIRPTLHIDMEDGTYQDLTFTNHPITLLYDYLVEKYDMAFGTLYWNAFTTGTPEKFYSMLQFLKKAPYFEEDRQSLRKRNRHMEDGSEDK